MENYNEMLKKIEEQEKLLQFNNFTNEMALELGMAFIKKAKAENKRITIDITRNGQQLFHYSFEGTSKDNDEWIIRKNNVVNRFYRSSLYSGLKLKKEGKTIEEKYHISSFEYAPYGGAFPIIIKDVGVVGTITVSGLSQIEDHNMVVDVIYDYLNCR